MKLAQPQIPPKKNRPREGVAEGGLGEEFRHARANTKSGQLRRPARSEQNPAQKFSFPFRRKNKSSNIWTWAESNCHHLNANEMFYR